MELQNQTIPKLWNANYTKVWLANFMIFFSFMLVMPILPLYLSEQFGAGKHTIGVVLSGYTVMALIARLFSGYIVDTYKRKTVLLISYGLFAGVLLRVSHRRLAHSLCPHPYTSRCTVWHRYGQQ